MCRTSGATWSLRVGSLGPDTRLHAAAALAAYQTVCCLLPARSFPLPLALRPPSPPPCWAASPHHLTTSTLPHTHAVLFGLLILLSIAVAAACYWMKWGLTATFLVACLWALNAVVMFLGMGACDVGAGHLVWHQFTDVRF